MTIFIKFKDKDDWKMAELAERKRYETIHELYAKDGEKIVKTIVIVKDYLKDDSIKDLDYIDWR